MAVESVSTAMPIPAKPIFRQRFCRAPACRALFFICSYCDRGQGYCSESCRQPARRKQCRQANRRQQQTLQGRVAHSRRQHAYRLRLARARHHCQRMLTVDRKNKVTDHSSQAPFCVRPSRRVSSLYWLTTIVSLRRSHHGLVVCRFCGRQGRFVNTLR
jgi:hypothetical protein